MYGIQHKINQILRGAETIRKNQPQTPDNEVAKTSIKLSKRPYYYQCGDGCCTEWGEIWYVNGVEVCSGPCDDNRLQQLLDHLGYDARIVNENEDGEEVCEL